jgi:hypothetical protein
MTEVLRMIEREERRLEQEFAQLLRRIKRECRPEFAERVETYLRSHGLLPPDGPTGSRD